MDSYDPFDLAKKNANGYGPTYEEWLAQIETERLAQEQLRQKALQKLTKLGLTEDEAKTVIGL